MGPAIWSGSNGLGPLGRAQCARPFGKPGPRALGHANFGGWGCLRAQRARPFGPGLGRGPLGQVQNPQPVEPCPMGPALWAGPQGLGPLGRAQWARPFRGVGAVAIIPSGVYCRQGERERIENREEREGAATGMVFAYRNL